MLYHVIDRAAAVAAFQDVCSLLAAKRIVTGPWSCGGTKRA